MMGCVLFGFATNTCGTAEHQQRAPKKAVFCNEHLFAFRRLH